MARATTQATTLTNVVTAVDNKAIGEQGAENTLAVQPNPVHTTAHITFTVKEDQVVQLHIYDAGGRVVARLYHGAAAAGRSYQVDWPVTGQAAGVYYGRLTTKKGVITRQLVVLQ